MYDKTFKTQAIIDITSDNVIIHGGDITKSLVQSILIQTGNKIKSLKITNCLVKERSFDGIAIGTLTIESRITIDEYGFDSAHIDTLTINSGATIARDYFNIGTLMIEQGVTIEEGGFS